MTTLKKINVLSIILCAATLIGIVLDLSFNWIDYGLEFLESKAAVSAVAVTAADPGVIFRCLAGLISGIVAIVAFVWLAINYLTVLVMLGKGRIFTQGLECRINRIGVGMIVIYVSELVLALALGGAKVNFPGFDVLCCGIGLVIVSQIFALGRQMKEEQEYTV